MLNIYKNSEFKGRKRDKLFRRSQNDIDAIFSDVKKWIDKIKKNGDNAIIEYVKKFDNSKFNISQIKVTDKDVKKAYKSVPKKTLDIIKRQISISRAFHKEQARRIYCDSEWEIETVPGVITGMKKTPIDSVGLYVPAGKAPLPTVAQILTVAAKAAGVPRICVFFPPTGDHNEIIVAAVEAGADEIYRVGGVAAIAAMAYGTNSIKPIDKIAGPGSPWVQAAKLQVFGQVGIDMLSGPSEALILADDTANAAWVAADILARIEHGPDSACPVITTSKKLAQNINLELKKQLANRARKSFINAAIKNGYSAIILASSAAQMIDLANEYAAEHLHIQTNDAKSAAAKINNAGSIFIGAYATVPIGDYASGTNHCLPTSRAVKFSSPVGVETFVKTNEYQYLTKQGLKNLQPIVETISRIEGLDGHEEAVNIRLRN